MRSVLGVSVVVVMVVGAAAGSAWAQPGAPSFTGGQIQGNGFPEPLIQASPGAIAPTGGSGGGSTGGGTLGTASASANITLSPSESLIQLSGTASHPNGPSGGYTGASSAQELIFSVTSNVSFTVSNASLFGADPFLPVAFRGITGTITGDPTTGGTLSPGTYGLRFAVAAGLGNAISVAVVIPSSAPNYFAYANVPSNSYTATASLDWKLTLVPGPSGGVVLGLGALVMARRRRG
jgi:hypothetical protein